MIRVAEILPVTSVPASKLPLALTSSNRRANRPVRSRILSVAPSYAVSARATGRAGAAARHAGGDKAGDARISAAARSISGCRSRSENTISRATATNPAGVNTALAAGMVSTVSAPSITTSRAVMVTCSAGRPPQPDISMVNDISSPLASWRNDCVSMILSARLPAADRQGRRNKYGRHQQNADDNAVQQPAARRRLVHRLVRIAIVWLAAWSFFSDILGPRSLIGTKQKSGKRPFWQGIGTFSDVCIMAIRGCLAINRQHPIYIAHPMLRTGC